MLVLQGRHGLSLDATEKMGQRDPKRLLIVGVIAVIRWAARRGTDDPWLAAAALANKMARTIIWDVATKKESCKAPASARETRRFGA